MIMNHMTNFEKYIENQTQDYFKDYLFVEATIINLIELIGMIEIFMGGMEILILNMIMITNLKM